MTDPAAATTMSTNNLGIDLNSALDILAQRTSAHTQHQTTENDNPNDSDIAALQESSNGISSKIGCGCCPVPNNLDNIDGGLKHLQRNGQVIDVGALTLNDGDNNSDNRGNKSRSMETKHAVYNEKARNADVLDSQEQLKFTQQQAVDRQVQLMSTIQSMTTNDTISAIFNTQEERVKCYRFFDEGLEHVLDTGNTEYYPLVCADVTATFTVLSATINAIRSDLGHRTAESAKAIVGLINRLQRAEQTKLQLTAALHLERIRSQAQKQPTSNGCTNSDEMDEIDNEIELQPTDPSLNEQHERIASLLEDSIHTLQKKIALTIEEINDVLEELRYTTVE